MGNTYYYTYNTYNDYDYFKLSSSNSDRIITFNININSILEVYQSYTVFDKDNQPDEKHDCLMHYDNISTSNIIYLMKDYDYYFKLTQNISYIGAYNFTVTSTVIDFSKYYMKTTYNNNSFVKYELMYADYSNASNSGFHGCYIPAIGTVGISNDGSASTSDREYFDINGSITGIFNTNNIMSYNYLDDNRYLSSNLNMPGRFVNYLEEIHFSNNGSRGSCFFIDDCIAMSAAHCLVNIDLNGNNYSKYLNLYTQINANYDEINQILYRYYYAQLTIQESYVPLNYLIAESNDEFAVTYDWALIKFEEDISEDYGYFGIEYNTNYNNINMYCMGYPGLFVGDVPSYNYKLTCSSSTFAIYSNVLTSYIDVSPGNSGGPCFYETYDGLYIARGITSAISPNNNFFAPINKYNYSLFLDIR